MQEIKVIKIGGSTVSKDKDNVFDYSFIASLEKVLMPFVEQGTKFFLTLGGGYTSRRYRDLAIEQGISTIEQHWIGTTVNVLHAQLVKSYFEKVADDRVIKFEDYYDESEMKIEKGILTGGGGRPGHSGDVDAILVAQKLGTKTVISLKNVDGVYDADPSKNPEAIRMDKLTWDEYLDIIGNKSEHEPGGNYPIDPIASRMAQEAGIEFLIMGSEDLSNLRLALNNEKFVGTIVKD